MFKFLLTLFFQFVFFFFIFCLYVLVYWTAGSRLDKDWRPLIPPPPPFVCCSSLLSFMDSVSRGHLNTTKKQFNKNKAPRLHPYVIGAGPDRIPSHIQQMITTDISSTIWTSDKAECCSTLVCHSQAFYVLLCPLHCVLNHGMCMWD